MKHYCVCSLILFLAVTIWSCNSKKETSFNSSPMEGETLIADTIIYDVIVKNTNPDDKWAIETLKNLKLQDFINEIIREVYLKEVVAYDYFTEKKIRPATLKKMEENADFVRDNIGKIQFTEIWYYNATTKQFRKEVISVVLGEELYDLDGGVRGYKPVFKINLTPSN